MDIKRAFAEAFKTARKAKGLSQEEFSDVSSRTYVSTLERAMKSVTLEKMNDLAGVMNIQPLTLLTLTYMNTDKDKTLQEILHSIEVEISQILDV